MNAPILKPGFELAPAQIGSVVVYVQCPIWCTVDHVNESVNDVVDIMHKSDAEGVYVSSFLKCGPTHELFARIQLDPAASDSRLQQAHVVVEDAGSDDAYLTPEMVEELAAEAINFGKYLLRLGAKVRAFNSDQGISVEEQGVEL